LLTFDDGFFSNYLLAKQILDPLGIKAIYFVPTDFIDSNDHTSQKSFAIDHLHHGIMPVGFNEDELRPMSWDQIKELVNKGHYIGAHTNSHRSLSTINEDKILEYEIISSADKIEKKLGVKIDHFAYPFGRVNNINKKAIDIAKKRFRFIHSGVRGENTPTTNPSALRREAVNIFDDIQLIKSIGLGGLSFLYWRKRRLLDRMAN
jgi:peptidoglycan/xylan/chitin deacetylase (PgdA/CDA1 family)